MSDNTSDIVEQLQTKAAMIRIGEKIAYGSDSALMVEAAAEIERLRGHVTYYEGRNRHLEVMCDLLRGDLKRCEEASR